MLILYICIWIFYVVEINLALPASERPKTTLIPIADIDETRFSPPYISTTKGCQGSQCRPPPNLIGPIVGSISGILSLALIGVFAVWIYYKRKYHKTAKIVVQPVPPKYIEQPSLYTDTISTTDSSSRFYGITPIRNDSIDSHLYEKINYNALP